ncbi:MAG: hypothetical protein AAFX99_24740, partial [Myxococcota bacterium]
MVARSVSVEVVRDTPQQPEAYTVPCRAGSGGSFWGTHTPLKLGEAEQDENEPRLVHTRELGRGHLPT